MEELIKFVQNEFVETKDFPNLERETRLQCITKSVKVKKQEPSSLEGL